MDDPKTQARRDRRRARRPDARAGQHRRLPDRDELGVKAVQVEQARKAVRTAKDHVEGLIPDNDDDRSED